MEKARVLIVEDDRASAKATEIKLLKRGYAVTGTTPTGEAAIEAAESQPPDLVLMDITLEGRLDGVETAKIIRDLYDIPTIFLTGSSDEETVLRARVSDPAGFLIKPLDEREMEISITIALHRHETERRLKAREKWFADILRCIGMGVIVTDAYGHVTYMNREAELCTGWTGEQAVAKDWREVLRSSTLMDLAFSSHGAGDIVQELAARGTGRSFHLTGASGEMVWVDATFSLIREGPSDPFSSAVIVLKRLLDKP